MRASRPRARPGVVEHRDPRAARLDHAGGREHPPQRLVVDVAVHAVDRRPEPPASILQHLDAHEVAGVQDQVGGAQLGDAARRQRPRAARHVGVGDDRDPHGPQR